MSQVLHALGPGSIVHGAHCHVYPEPGLHMYACSTAVTLMSLVLSVRECSYDC